MIRKILTPVQLPPESNKTVVQYAVDLSKIFGAKLVLLHPHPVHAIYPAASGSLSGVPSVFQVQPGYEKRLRESQLNSVLHDVPDLRQVPYEYVVKPGAAADLISIEANRSMADLIVVGTNGATGMAELTGTKAEKVTREAPCPVLVLPFGYPFQPIRKISLAIDYDHSVNDADLSAFMLLARAFRPTLDVISVQHPKEEHETINKTFLSHLKNRIEKLLIRYSVRTVLATDIEKGIMDFADRHQINLLALIYREHGFFRRLFDPGVRKKLVFHSEIPLLILK